MKKFLMLAFWVITCFVAYMVGALGGYAKGTAVSTVVASAGMALDRANYNALLLTLMREKTQTDFMEFAEQSLIRDIDFYYAQVGIEIYEDDLFKRFNYFEALVINDLQPAANYVRKYKNEVYVRNSRTLTRLFNENPN